MEREQFIELYSNIDNDTRSLESRVLQRFSGKSNLRTVPHQQINTHGVDDYHHDESHEMFEQRIFFLFVLH